MADWFSFAVVPALWNAKPIPLGSTAKEKDTFLCALWSAVNKSFHNAAYPKSLLRLTKSLGDEIFYHIFISQKR